MLLGRNDTIPSIIDSSKMSYLSEFLIPSTSFMSDSRTAVQWANNGVAHSFHICTILDTGDEVWMTVKTVLIQLNTSLTPSSHFPVYSNESVPDANGVEIRIGYDAAVCMEMYEPWIIKAYNTSVGSPTILRIVKKGYGKTSLPSGHIHQESWSKLKYLNAWI